jgi:predicted HD phosphohydrolase
MSELQGAGAADPLSDIDALLGLLETAADVNDEGLSILDHGLQCAHLLAAEHPDDVELQVAGLVHDLGWLERGPDDRMRMRPDAAHDARGARLVAPLLGSRVARLVGGHVTAKRYLVVTDPSYRALLSPGSAATLEFQGGDLEAGAMRAFAASLDRDDIVTLRRADERAKVPGASVPGLARWRSRLEQVAAMHAA